MTEAKTRKKKTAIEKLTARYERRLGNLQLKRDELVRQLKAEIETIDAELAEAMEILEKFGKARGGKL